MQPHVLLTSQRNELFLLVQAAGLALDGFRWQDSKSRMTENLQVPRLLHEPSGYYFRFELFNGKHHCQYAPGVETVSQERYPGSWALQLEYFKDWLTKTLRCTRQGAAEARYARYLFDALQVS